MDGALPVFAVDHPHRWPPRQLAGLLGGKGAGLAEMTSVVGLPGPPGFTLGVPLCAAYRTAGWPDGLDELVENHLRRLEERIGRRFGAPDDPLLLAVRSGAPRSMPGMLDTVLNLGCTDATEAGLAAASGDATFARESHRRFLATFAITVLGAPPSLVDGLDEPARMRSALAEADHPVPDDPRAQLRAAIEAVFRSWDGLRARAYRRREGIPDDLGTAVTVQAMVFGNADARSGTGVVFTRDPATGEKVPYGDVLPRAQGEDVVAGTATTMPIAAMADLLATSSPSTGRPVRSCSATPRQATGTDRTRTSSGACCPRSGSWRAGPRLDTWFASPKNATSESHL